MRYVLVVAMMLATARAEMLPTDEPTLLTLKRVYVDKLVGGADADAMRQLIIASLHGSKLYVITEDPDRADAFIRGTASDVAYTDQLEASDGVDLRAGVGAGARSSSASRNNGGLLGTAARSLSISVGDDEKINIHERKHEAMASLRMVSRQGDVIWSTTQESGGAKFRSASADVAEKITRQLRDDVARARRQAIEQ
jgi:hypothetical protein